VITVLTLFVTKVKESQALRLVLLGVACLFGGAEAFSATQHMGYGTALYWAITTATTVGYGDVTPKSSAGRVVASAVMLTTIPLFASAFALFAGAVATAHLRRLLGMEHREASGREVVIFGLHPVVPGIAAALSAAGREVVVVATGDRSALPDAVHVVSSDPTTEEGVRRGHPDRAAQVLITGTDDAAVLVTTVLVHQQAPQAPVLAVATSASVCRALRELGVDAAVSGDELLAHTLAKSLEAPHAGELLLRIMDSDGFELQELPVDREAVGKALSAVRDAQAGLVLGAVHGGAVVMGVVDDPILAEGDRILVLAPDRLAPHQV
jgi:voltage-gated potassium channel